jgi:hypothetical protein
MIFDAECWCLGSNVSQSQLTVGTIPARHDPYQAINQMNFMAFALDLHFHQMSEFAPTRAHDAFSVLDVFPPTMILSIGRPIEPLGLPLTSLEKKFAPRNGNPTEVFIHVNQISNHVD